MTQSPLIGIWSQAPGAGKSTVARFIRLANPAYRRLGISDDQTAMVSCLLQSCDISWHQSHDALHVNKDAPVSELPGNPSTRQLRLQIQLGLKDLGGNFWLSLFNRRLAQSGQPVVVDDLSSLETVEFVRSKGGKILCVERHSAEGQVNDVLIDCAVEQVQPDVVVVNDGSLNDLEIRVAMALAQIEGE